MEDSKTVIIAGAGPAGLTAAYEILKRQSELKPIVFEMGDQIGGISQTIRYNGNRMDIGGHRFFSKNKEIMDWWMKMVLLLQQIKRRYSVGVERQGFVQWWS